ncbi:hypothetical protein LZ30DRAFT_38654 [Colletotrichum cereale]|nr:hypothetical protein LZ30DRAFT_38654 [Colletotrichum cereale]
MRLLRVKVWPGAQASPCDQSRNSESPTGGAVPRLPPGKRGHREDPKRRYLRIDITSFCSGDTPNRYGVRSVTRGVLTESPRRRSSGHARHAVIK